MEYIRQSGKDIKIKQFLLESNIPLKDIDDAITHIKNSAIDSSNSVLEVLLQNHIQNQLNNGYHIEMVIGKLINEGIITTMLTRYKVSSDLNNANIGVKHKVSSISKSTIIGIVASIVIVGVIFLGIFSSFISIPIRRAPA